MSAGLPHHRSSPTIEANWPRIVGPLIASMTMPGRFLDGELEVRVTNEEWISELREMTQRLVQRIGEVHRFSPWQGPVPIVTTIRWVATLTDAKVLPFRRRSA